MRNKQQFVETIKVKDGVFYNLPLHSERLRITAFQFYGASMDLDLSVDAIPVEYLHGIYKCRVVYSSEIEEISFTPYSFREFEDIVIIEDDNIDYSYKSTDREVFTQLLNKKGAASEIMIVKNGLITDSSFSNFVFENSLGLFTPDTYLLNGVKRQSLLKRGVIKECQIRKEDVLEFDRVYLINAMIDLEDQISIPISQIYSL